MRTLYRAALVCAASLTLFAPAARATEPDTERDRKARAALALAGSKAATVATAPAPRLVVPKDYPTASRLATEQSKPLVVFVGCRADHATPAGAVAARTESLPGVTGPAAVVLYPSGGELYRHTVLVCPVEEAKLAEAVRAAAKKVDATAKTGDAPAPKALDWDVRADGPKPDCANCDKCPNCGKAAKADPRDSIARVRRDMGDRYEMGSGTVVHSGAGWSLVLTAAHVVDGPGKLTVRAAGKTYAATVVETDKAADLAAVLVPADLPAVKVAADDVRDGAEVTMYGMTSVYSRGTVSGRHHFDGVEQLAYATAADSENGDSGAGVFAGNELVAVHLGKVGTEAGAKPRAAATGPVRAFLKRVLGKPVTATPPAPAAKPTELPKADPKPAAAPTAALPAGAIRTSSGRVIVPTGSGTYRYLDEPAAGAPSCPSGRCPLQR